MNIWEALESGSKQRRGQHRGSGRRQSNPYEAGCFFRGPGDLYMRLFQRAQNALRMPVQRFTGRRTRNTLPTPEQQLSTKIILERGYLLAQSGLRDTEQL